MPAFLLIDDDHDLYALIRDFFIGMDFQLEHASSAELGLSRLFLEPTECDAVILDVMLPGVDGLAALKQIRASPKTQDLPILMLTALDAEKETIAAFEAGADDYLTKPFSLMELVARLNAILRRTSHRVLLGKNNVNTLICGNLVINRAAHMVVIDGKDIRLTPAEMRILEILATEQGKIVHRNCLNQKLSGNISQRGNRGLDMTISRLRKKLGYGKNGSERIQAVWGEGYTLLLNGDEP